MCPRSPQLPPASVRPVCQVLWMLRMNCFLGVQLVTVFAVVEVLQTLFVLLRQLRELQACVGQIQTPSHP